MPYAYMVDNVWSTSSTNPVGEAWGEEIILAEYQKNPKEYVEEIAKNLEFLFLEHFADCKEFRELTEEEEEAWECEVDFSALEYVLADRFSKWEEDFLHGAKDGIFGWLGKVLR